MFKSVEKLGVTLIRFHGQLIIRNLITEDTGILDYPIIVPPTLQTLATPLGDNHASKQIC
jgi:hypothetical protein